MAFVSGFEVRPDAVAGHAREVAELVGRVQAAATAGEATQAMDGTAYGLIGQAFARQARAAVDGGVRVLASTAGTGHAMAAGLESSAACYRQVERDNTGLLGGR
jgi:hypothetical protein